MRILPYYLLHTIVNSIKKLFRNKVIAIVLALILGMGVIGGVIGVTVGYFLGDIEEPASSYEEYDENYEDYPEEDEDEDLTEEDLQTIFMFIEAGVGALVLLVVLGSIYGGDKSGVKIFTMADVNFLFASPMKPQSVLMFKTVLQMGVAIVSSIYLLFQFPNLMNLGLDLRECLCIFAAWIFMLFIGKLASVFTYTVAATHPSLRKAIRPFVYTVAGLLLLTVVGLNRVGGLTLTEAVRTVFVGKYHRFIPLFGWFQGFVMSAIDGRWWFVLLYFVLLVALCVIVTFLIWRIKADFYEDALQNANEMQEMLENAKSGVIKRKKTRSQKIARNREMSGIGAAVFFGKTVYNRRRFAKLGIFTATSTTYLSLALLCGLFLRFVVQSSTLLPIGFILLVVMFFRNLGNPLATETDHLFLYLTPESAFQKLLFCMAGCLYETAMDLLPAFLVTAVFCNGDFSLLVGWLLVWLSLDLFCSSVGLFIELALPSYFVPAIQKMLGMSIRMAAILPGAIILIIGAATNLLPALAGVLALNLAVSAVLLWVTPYFLHAGKN